jgi:hypothetical protein
MTLPPPGVSREMGDHLAIGNLARLDIPSLGIAAAVAPFGARG